jgi:hypothetical protein
MNKSRAQITIFMIVGIIVLFIIAGSIALYSKMSAKETLPIIDKTATIQNKAKTVDTYIKECLDSVGKEGLLTIGLQGGYYNLPERYFSLEYTDVPYYYYEENIAGVLSKEEIAANLGKYIDDNIGYCLNDFEEFTVNGYIIETGEPKTTVTVGDTRLFAKLNMDVSVDNNMIKTDYNTFSADYPGRLEEIYQTVNELLTNTIIDPYRIYYSLILNLMEEHNLQIDSMTYSDDTVIYVIQDPQSVINEVPFVFLFAIKVNTTNVPPELDIPSEMTAEADKEFYYQVFGYDREDAVLEYSTDSDFFGINTWTGEIYFIPDAADIGMHDVSISVYDGIDTTTKKVKFMVI